MDAAIARSLRRHLDRAYAGANLCRARLAQIVEDAPRIAGIVDLRGQQGHDVDYYAFEVVRVQNIARAVAKADAPESVDQAIVRLSDAAPGIRDFRNALAHVDEQPDPRLEDVTYFGQAVRLLSGGEVEYLVDPRTEAHDALTALVDVCRAWLVAEESTP